MLPLKFLREHADLVRADLKKRGEPEKLDWLEEVLHMDQEWRRLKHEADQLKSRRNSLSQQINELKKAGQDAGAVFAEVKAIPAQIKVLDDAAQQLQEKMRRHQMRLPNILHESVPQGKGPEDNALVKEFGKKPLFDFPPKNHTDLIEGLGLVDLERAAKISGSRFYFLTGGLARLDLALQQYAVDFLAKRKFTLVSPPLMMNRAAYEGVTDLKDFEDMMYKLDGEDLYLIATSEHPLTAQFMDETFSPQGLPVRLMGHSACFRKEAGAHGKEEKGIWRVHHFTKVEQIIICAPQDSWKHHEELIGNAIDFFESLGLAFRQVNICTADIGIVAAKKYDLEAWIPSVQEHKEIVSCSNCTAYQAARLNLRYETNQGTDFVHTLNSTLVATSRALVAILEQFQQKDGSVLIPKVLQPYMDGEKSLRKAA